MSIGPVDPIEIGPALRQTAAVVLRHWLIAALSVAGIGLWAFLMLFVVGRSMASSTDSPASIIIWFGVRFIAWLTLGALAYRILIAEVGIGGAAPESRDPRQRLYLACVLCFASVTMVVFVVRLAITFGLDAIGIPEGNKFIDEDPLSIAYLAEIAVINAAWAYLAARFGTFALFLLRDGEDGGFGRSWSAASGNRFRFFLLFLSIQLPLNVLNEVVFRNAKKVADLEPAAQWLSTFTQFSEGDPVNVMVGLCTYPLSTVAAAVLYSGAFVAIHHRLAVSEMQVFD